CRRVAAVPAGRDLCPRWGGTGSLADGPVDGPARLRTRATGPVCAAYDQTGRAGLRRRDPAADPGARLGQGQNRLALGLCPGRPPLWRVRTTHGGLSVRG